MVEFAAPITPRVKEAAAIPEYRETRLCSKDVLVILILFVLIVATWLPRIAGPIDLRWDGGTYYILGTALAEGKGYRLLNEPGEIEAIQYPPLLPAIVAAHQLMLGTNDPVVVGLWLRRSFFLIFTAYILLTYLMLRIYLRELYAFLATLMCLGHLFTNFLSDVLLAEIPFGVASLLFVLACRKPAQPRHTILAGFFATIAYLLRTIGVTLFAAWIAESLLQKQFRQAALRLAVALIPIVLWQSYVSSIENSSSYQHPSYSYQRDEYLFYNVSYVRNLSLQDPLHPELGKASLEDMGRRLLRNLIDIPGSLGEAVSVTRIHWQGLLFNRLPRMTDIFSLHMSDAVAISLGSLVLVGIAILLIHGQWVVSLYMAAYILAVCFTPWPEQRMRYWTPLAPFLVLALCQGLLTLEHFWATVSSQLKTIFFVLPAAVLFLIVLVEGLTLVHAYKYYHGQAIMRERNGELLVFRLFFYDNSYKALDQGLDWVQTHARPSDVVAAAMPHWAYLKTSLKTVMPPFESDLKKGQELLDSVPVRYVIVDKTAVDVAAIIRKSILPILQDTPGVWTEIYSTPSGLLQIYERAREGTQARGGKVNRGS